MANYTDLKAAIQQVIRENGNEEITGDLLQQVLLAIVNSLGAGYLYMGIATPSTDPGTPDQNVFYFALTAGTYTDFGGIVIAEGEIAILRWDSAWHKDTIGTKVQADWDQDDPAEDDYIKHRTHYEEPATASLEWDTDVADASRKLYLNLGENRVTLNPYIGLFGLLYWRNVENNWKWQVTVGDTLELWEQEGGENARYEQYDGFAFATTPQPFNLGFEEGTIVHKLDNKFLDMDAEPTTGSGKPVTSGGVKAALDDIPAQEQSDWDEDDTSSPAYIKNKPTIPTQKQSDWDEDDTSDPAYIKNKPTIPTDVLKYTEQTLTDAQKGQSRTNIGAADAAEVSQLRSEVDGVEETIGATIPLEQGSIDSTGTETNNNKRVRTSGFLVSPIKVETNSGYQVYYAYHYNKNTKAFISPWVPISSDSFEYDGDDLIRLVFSKTDTSQTLSPTDSIISDFSAGISEQIENVREDVAVLQKDVNGTPLNLEQGGIDTSGRETVNAARVRTNVLEGAFEVAANSGYQVYYAYYYNKSGTFVRSAAVNSSSFVNNGGYNVRLAFAKSDATQPLTPEDNIIDTYKGGLQYTVEQSPIMSVCDSLSQIPSPADASLCFFRQRNGAWSDGEVWREIVGNNLLISGTAYRTCKVGDGSKVSGHDDETVLPLYSVTKLMTLVVVCDNVSDYSEQVTILADDIPSSTSDHYVQIGDVVTIDDLIAAAVIVSDNPAAQALARVVGHKINPSAADDNAARSAFYAAMNTKATALGMSDTTYGGAAWVGGNSTATDQCVLLREIYNNYPKITSYWGLLNHTMTITGNNARTYQITSTVNAAARQVIPEFVGGKTGTGSNLGNLAFVWLYDGVYYTSIVFQASPVNYRVKDAAQAIAEAKELN